MTAPLLIGLPGGRSDGDAPKLTRAEARALRRSAPLTHVRLNEHLAGVSEPPQLPAS